MGLGKKIKRGARKIAHHTKKVRKHLGMTSDNKLWRQSKRRLSTGGTVGSMSPGNSSAGDINLAMANAYRYQPRSISSLMR